MRTKSSSTTASAAAVLLTVCACSEGETASVCSGVSIDRPVLVLEVDLARQAAALGRIDETGCLEEVPDLALGDDPVLANAHGRPHVLNRTTGEIHEIDREELRIARTVAAMPVGESSPNPWDVDLDPDGRLWIARYDVDSIGIVGADGSWQGEIGLGEHADADGISPEASVIEVVGDTAYVVLERLDRKEGYLVNGPGRVAAFAVDAPHEPRGSFDLSTSNPLTATRVDEGSIAVASPGDHWDLLPTDGVEIVDLEGGTSKLVLDEKTAGGSVLEVVIAAESEGYAIVEGPSEANPTSVIAFDPLSRTVTARLAEAGSFVHAGLAIVGRHVLVGERTKGAARVLFFERATHALAGSLAPQLMPPLALMRLD